MVGVIHSPADIVRRALIALNLGSNPDAAGGPGAWPVYCDDEPNTPDNIIAVHDTSDGVEGGRVMQGEEIEYPGVQVKVRAKDHPTCYAKASAIGDALQDLVRAQVTMPTPEATVYLLAWMKRRPFGYVGKEKPVSRRNIITINYYVSVRLDVA